tara:strand:+ start:5570 stop:6268 length:699 start_codon:yes stop_codon:yes gene_type:complete
MFTDQQVKDLSDKLDRSNVKERNQGGRAVSYIEGWWAIAEANRIFGYGNWERRTLSNECVANDNVRCTYVACVQITVRSEDGTEIVRQGTGAGHGKMKNAGDNHESAAKEAETDAMKRALMTFGNPFGLALYDKDKAEVGESRAAEEKKEHAHAAATKQWEKDKKWVEEQISKCNETKWSSEQTFEKWLTSIRPEASHVQKTNPTLLAQLKVEIDERKAIMAESEPAQAAAE